MGAYAARRILALIPTMLFASLIVFLIIRMVPGDVIDLMMSQNDISADAASRDELRKALGMDASLPVQYMNWMGNIVLHGDLGRSLWQNEPVGRLILSRVPATLSLGLMAMTIALLLALPIGVFSALRQDTKADYLFRSFSILMLAIPSFWLGTMVMVFPSIWWGWSPQVNYTEFSDDPVGHVKQMLVPAMVLGLALSALTMRLTRTMMLEVMRQDYIRTAWAKGLSETLIEARHA